MLEKLDVCAHSTRISASRPSLIEVKRFHRMKVKREEEKIKEKNKEVNLPF